MAPRSDPAKPTTLIPERFEPLMVLVRRTSQSSQAVFQNAFDLLCFGAALGFARGEKGAIATNGSDKASGGEVVMDNPERKDRVLCDMLAIVDSDSDEILAAGRLQERIDVFAGYACGGLDYLLTLTESRSAREAVEAIIRGTDVDSSVVELEALLDDAE